MLGARGAMGGSAGLDGMVDAVVGGCAELGVGIVKDGLYAWDGKGAVVPQIILHPGGGVP